MNNRTALINAMLWASAIAAAAILGAPRFLWLVLLPMLAMQALRVNRQRACTIGSKQP
jgi:hypothetical protein